VKFSDEVEELVSCETMREWWNQGVHEKSLSTHCFLVRCSIPERILGLALVSSWKINIYNTLKFIPTIATEGMNAYFDTMDSKRSACENLLNEAHVFFQEHFGLNNDIVFLPVTVGVRSSRISFRSMNSIWRIFLCYWN
jgi:hypothetical protein